MGPYGVDRAVHSIEFKDCENGLGKSTPCIILFSISIWETIKDGCTPNGKTY